MPRLKPQDTGLFGLAAAAAPAVRQPTRGGLPDLFHPLAAPSRADLERRSQQRGPSAETLADATSLYQQGR